MPGLIFDELKAINFKPIDRKIQFNAAGSSRSILDNGSTAQSSSTHGVGPGLINLGNSCFLNSVLQCLTHLPPLARILAEGKHKSDCAVPGFCVRCALETHVMRCLKSSNHRAIAPKMIFDNLRKISRTLRPGRQEDAHEFTRFLFEKMDKTNVYNLFKGKLRSRVLCLKCQTCSDTNESMMDVSLEIKHAQSLEEALSRFMKREMLNKDNQYRCSVCNQLCDAQKQISIRRAPQILTIHLKRFGFSRQFGSKITRHIQFKPTLSLSPYMSKASSDATYKLKAVLVHSGSSCHSGHYLSFVKGNDNAWFCMNDEFVNAVSEAQVLSQSAYMLFYVKQTAHVEAAQAKSEPKANCIVNPPASEIIPAKNPSSSSKKKQILDEMTEKPLKAVQQRQSDTLPLKTVASKNEQVEPNFTQSLGRVQEHTGRTCNSTVPWKVQEMSDSNEVSVKPRNELQSTSSWRVLDGISNIKKWETDDENTEMMEKRRIIEESFRVDKRPRPSASEIEYDMPKKLKKKRKMPFSV